VHVFLAAYVAGLADPLQDLVGGHLVALRGPLGMQQEAGVHARVPLGDRAAVRERQPRNERPDHVLRRGHRGLHVHAGRDAEPLERRDQHLGGRVPGPGAERAQRPVNLQCALLSGQHGVGDAE
jgi:hypothetical protein